MMIACGLQQYNIALFHLTTHAFFKALLFLSAGSIIHALYDEQDIRKMGGLLRYLPLTYVCFLVGSYNLMGLPFLGGFYSKDLILEMAYSSYTTVGLFCYIVGLISVFFTAAYSIRLCVLVFFKTSARTKKYTYTTMESSYSIKIPLILLSIISIVCGYYLIEIFGSIGNSNFLFSIYQNPSSFILGDNEFLPMYIKILPQFIVLSGFLFSFYLFLFYTKNLLEFKKHPYLKFIFFFFKKMVHGSTF